MLSCDLSFKDGKDNDARGFALLGLLEPQRQPAVEARQQGLALATNAAGAQRMGHHPAEVANAYDPRQIQSLALWAHLGCPQQDETGGFELAHAAPA